MTMYTQKKIYITWMPSLLDVKVWGTGTVFLSKVGLALTMGRTQTGDGHARQQSRLGTIMQKCMPVKTVSKWPIQKFKATKL